MTYKISKKHIRTIGLCFFCMLYVILGTVYIQANDSFNPDINISLSTIKQDRKLSIPNEIRLQELSEMDTLNITLELSLPTQSRQVALSIINQSGYQYLPYPTSNFKVNGINGTYNDYKALTSKQGYQTTLNQTKLILEFDVSNAPDNSGLLWLETLIQTKQGNQILSKNQGFEFKSNVGYPSNYMISFYDQDTLISREIVESGKLVKAPFYQKEGYHFLGFTKDPNGTSGPYQEQATYNHEVYYAQFQKQEFTIRYFIEDKLYKSETVAYGESPKPMELPKLEGKTFLFWSESLESIKRNTDVYAVFQEDESKEMDVSITLKSKHSSNQIENRKDVVFSNQEASNGILNWIDKAFFSTVQTIKSNLPIVLVLFAFILLFIFYRKSQRNRKSLRHRK